MTKEEIRRKQIMLQRKAIRMKRLRRKRAILIGCMFAAFIFIVGGISLLARAILTPNKEPDISNIQTPSWIDQQFLVKNPYSRPGDKVEGPNGIVVHYTANAGTTAQNNRDFFNSLANQTKEKKESVSSHFVIGIDGEIIQCIPLDEIAYTSNQRNVDTISIECCHIDETGEFTDATYQSLVKLTAWLSAEFGIKEKELIRHYDVKGKECPLYFVVHEDKWLEFKAEVKKAVESLNDKQKTTEKPIQNPTKESDSGGSTKANEPSNESESTDAPTSEKQTA